jgi:hypothetical protein
VEENVRGILVGEDLMDLSERGDCHGSQKKSQKGGFG